MTEQKYLVLIADDQQEDRFLLKIVIRKRAPLLRVVGEAPDADALVNYLSGNGPFADREQHPFPDLLIMDARLPLQNGLEVLEWLKTRNFPPLKIAVVTDANPGGDRTNALERGADYIFEKPSDLRELERMVKVLENNLKHAKPVTAPPAR